MLIGAFNAFILHFCFCTRWSLFVIAICNRPLKRPTDCSVLYEEVYFATQAAYNHYNDNQWACKDRYVHRTLYKILKTVNPKWLREARFLLTRVTHCFRDAAVRRLRQLLRCSVGGQTSVCWTPRLSSSYSSNSRSSCSSCSSGSWSPPQPVVTAPMMLTILQSQLPTSNSDRPIRLLLLSRDAYATQLCCLSVRPSVTLIYCTGTLDKQQWVVA